MVNRSKDIVVAFKRKDPDDPYADNSENKNPFLDLAAVAPSPSRDYYRIYVTQSEVALTQWRISHGPRSVPLELKIPLESFSKDARIPSEVSRVFGKECADYILGLSRGHIDKIMQLPERILAKIFHHTGIENLRNIAPVCSKFAAVCRSDDLWKRFYFQYGGFDAAAAETKHQADYLTWKSLFFINRLHYKIGNPEKFSGLLGDYNLNIPSPRLRNIPSRPPSSSSVLASTAIHREVLASKLSAERKTVRGSASNRVIASGRPGRVVEGNLVGRDSVANLPREHSHHRRRGSSRNSSPRSSKTNKRYALLGEGDKKKYSLKQNLS